MELYEWMKSREHLPPILRDFSIQGWLFRWLDENVQRAKSKRGADHVTQSLPNSIVAHVYVIDYFLHFMAMFGYTLQKTKKRGVEFYDLRSVIDTYEQEQRQVFWDELKKDLAAKRDMPA